jgi:hypothetical protein
MNMNTADPLLNPRINTLIVMIAAAAATRLLPHPPNMTSVAAVALFGGAYFSNRWLAFLVPLAALLVSDLLLGFYQHMEFIYLSFALIVWIGLGLQRRQTASRIAAATVLSALVFFVVSDFGIWAFGSLYPKTYAGLIACYVAAIPFLRNMLLGDALYTAILFGGFRLLEARFAALRNPANPANPAHPAAAAESVTS